MAKQGVHSKDIADTKQAEEIGEAIQEREDLKTVLTWSERKETYTHAQDHLSQIYETEADPESGKTKKLEVKQFEAVVGTLMRNPKVVAAIQKKIDAGDRKIIGLQKEYRDSPIHGEGTAYLMMQEALGADGIAELVATEDMQGQLQQYQKDHADQYRKKSKEEGVVSRNLTRNYIRTIMESSANPEALTWPDMEQIVLKDKRLTPIEKRGLVATFYDGIFQHTAEQPLDYINRITSLTKEDGTKNDNGYERASVEEVLSQQEKLRKYASSDFAFLAFPEIKKQLPPEFVSSAEKLVNDGIENLSGANPELANEQTENHLEQTVELLSPEAQQEVVTVLVELEPSYAETFTKIQERRVEQGQPPLTFDVPEVTHQIETPEISLEQIELVALNTEITLEGNLSARVIKGENGERLLDIEGIPMNKDLAEDTANRDRMIEEARVTGLNYCTAEENLKIFSAINEVIARGGAKVPPAKLDLSDGISMVGGERETYLLVRQYFTELQGGGQS